MTKYIDMPPNLLHNKLVKAFPNPEQREWEKARILKEKEAQRTKKIKTLMHAKLWRNLLNPLKYEISSARVGLSYEGKFKEERVRAFTAYMVLMQKLLHKFTLLREQTYDVKKKQDYDVKNKDGTVVTMQRTVIVTKQHTPSSIAQEFDIPNRGVHWTDWVPQSKRIEIVNLFEQIPYAPKTKRKIPFQRTQRPNTKQKETLLGRTEKELVLAITEHRANPTEENERLVRRIKEALKLIDELKPSDAVPHTWHGIEQGENE